MGLFSKSFSPETDLPDLKGNVIIVTGGNSGVGCAAIQHLARKGAKVYMAARSEEKAKAAIEKVQKAGLEPGNGEVVWLPLDYSDPRDAKKAAEVFMEKEQRLDIVVNSAALLLTPFTKTSDGIQEIAVVNYFSPFVFVRTLLPLLKRTAQEPKSDVRIVMLTSEGHRMPPKDCHFRSIEDFNREFKDESFASNRRYNLSKYMGVLHVKELQRRLDAEEVPIIVTAVHPGIVNTGDTILYLGLSEKCSLHDSDGVQNFAHSAGTFKAPVYAFIANAFFTSPEKGAYSTVFAAAAPAVREDVKYKGGYIVPPGKLGSVYSPTEDPELGKELWETTEKILADIGV
ncbi:NAD-P-binding protein [Fomitopsis serialis]|uniref:NAD-P-binding protein n=1 Tax=Fomitopsis serialis TaxID=139415 RepID=UPI0020078944|nr:NAD-P-binding protein [Neoantrodia serialis]KAH9928811.1 NAD-P-binding protein [Neoantrodia serialis]